MYHVQPHVSGKRMRDHVSCNMQIVLHDPPSSYMETQTQLIGGKDHVT